MAVPQNRGFPYRNENCLNLDDLAVPHSRKPPNRFVLLLDGWETLGRSLAPHLIYREYTGNMDTPNIPWHAPHCSLLATA